jgi:SEC-C motif-containing protein
MTTCPCGSTKPFELCCQPVIAGHPAETAEALMRSRYSAYVVGDVDYLQKTSAGEALMKFDRADLKRSIKGSEWLGLEILGTTDGLEGDNVGSVTFRARFRENGQIGILSERSEFRRIGGKWHYFRGDMEIEGGQARPRVGRNDPCPCGSGKKFKKCHGA